MESPQSIKVLLEQFNANTKSSALPIKRCSELKENKHYIIHQIRKVDTTVGDAILVLLSNSPYKSGDGPKCQVFLPKRFVHLLENENLSNILPGMLYLQSHGVNGHNSSELSIHVNSEFRF